MAVMAEATQKACVDVPAPAPAKEGKKSKSGGKARRRANYNSSASSSSSNNNTRLYSPSMYKRRFCATYPNVNLCKRGQSCAFAHSRQEFRGPLLTEEEEKEEQHSDEFYMYKFKTKWCPIGVQHDWQTCIYSHNYLDIRRNPAVGYGPRPCPHWDRRNCMSKYDARCPHGVSCPYAHGAKEQLYHPSYFKSVVCWDLLSTKGCPRGKLCAFHHEAEESRASLDGVGDDFEYGQPLPQENLTRLQSDFSSPPQLGEDGKTKGGGKDGDMAPPAQPIPQQAGMPMMIPMMPMPEHGSPSANPKAVRHVTHVPQMFMMPVQMPVPGTPCQAAVTPHMSPQNGQCSPQQMLSPHAVMAGMPPMFLPVNAGLENPWPASPAQADGSLQRGLFEMPDCNGTPVIMVPMGAPLMMRGRVDSRSTMTPMQAYAQDIMNADGDNFDLDVEKYQPPTAPLSDATTDDTNEQQQSISAAEEVLA